jgi:hypothetical protein
MSPRETVVVGNSMRALDLALHATNPVARRKSERRRKDMVAEWWDTGRTGGVHTIRI